LTPAPHPYEEEPSDSSSPNSNSEAVKPRQRMVDVEDIFSTFTEIDKLEFDKLYAKRKTELEMQAESRAKLLSAKWTREGLSLTTIIDQSLREYIDMYETAHALRLQFEAEKLLWKSTAMKSIQTAGNYYGGGGDYYLPNQPQQKSNESYSHWKGGGEEDDALMQRHLTEEFQYTPSGDSKSDEASKCCISNTVGATWGYDQPPRMRLDSDEGEGEGEGGGIKRVLLQSPESMAGAEKKRKIANTVSKYGRVTQRPGGGDETEILKNIPIQKPFQPPASKSKSLQTPEKAKKGK